MSQIGPLFSGTSSDYPKRPNPPSFLFNKIVGYTFILTYVLPICLIQSTVYRFLWDGSVLSRVIVGQPLAPFGGEGGDPAVAGEPGEGLGTHDDYQELCGHHSRKQHTNECH